MGLKEFLRGYFIVPYSGGFSPYRTGVLVHIMFSTYTGCILSIILAGLLRWNPFIVSGLIFAAILMLWGLGARLGILSHYNPLITLAFFAAPGAIVVWKSHFLPFFKQLSLGIGVGFSAHILWSIILPKQK